MRDIAFVAFLFAFIGVGFWLWLGIADGQRGANRFGPDPVHPARDTADTFN